MGAVVTLSKGRCSAKKAPCARSALSIMVAWIGRSGVTRAAKSKHGMSLEDEDDDEDDDDEDDEDDDWKRRAATHPTERTVVILATR